MTVIVVATVTPLPEHRAEVIELFEATIARVHTEQGCELYALHEGADELLMIEKWSGAEQLEQHSSGRALADLGPQLDGKLAGPTVVKVYRPHPAGTVEQGTV